MSGIIGLMLVSVGGVMVMSIASTSLAALTVGTVILTLLGGLFVLWGVMLIVAFFLSI